MRRAPAQRIVDGSAARLVESAATLKYEVA